MKRDTKRGAGLPRRFTIRTGKAEALRCSALEQLRPVPECQPGGPHRREEEN